MTVLPNAIYAAEDAVDTGERLERMADVQAFVKHVVRSRLWRRLTPVREVHLMLTWDDFNAAWVSRGVGIIQLHRPMSRMGICHELAHIPHYAGPTKRPDHGREWLKTYVALVDHFLGARQARRLREEIVARKVYGYRALVDELDAGVE